jgi:hypothetical protein
MTTGVEARRGVSFWSVFVPPVDDDATAVCLARAARLCQSKAPTACAVEVRDRAPTMAAEPPNLGTNSPVKPAHGVFFVRCLSVSFLSVCSLNVIVFLLITDFILFTEDMMFARCTPRKIVGRAGSTSAGSRDVESSSAILNNNSCADLALTCTARSDCAKVRFCL